MAATGLYFGEICDDDGSPAKVWLQGASSVPINIKRRVKAQGEANPYDPAYETYFDQRGQGRGMMLETFGAARTLRYLWLEQHGFCTVCKKKITRITGLRLHHCVSRVIS